MQLWLKERRDHPPTFLELLTEIRAEEEHERARKRVSTHVRSVAAGCNLADVDVIEGLRAELKTLKNSDDRNEQEARYKS